MSEHQTTFVMIKPDGVARGLVGEIITRIERKGLRIACMEMQPVAARRIVELHYAHHGERPFYKALVESGCAGPIVLMAVWGLNAVSVMRTMLGATAGFEAMPGTIRGDFSCSQRNNLVHSSDSLENAHKELDLWFHGVSIEAGVAATQKLDKTWVYSVEERR